MHITDPLLRALQPLPAVNLPAHSAFGPSSSAQRQRCPGSWREELRCGLEKPTSTAAALGTRAHQMAETALLSNEVIDPLHTGRAQIAARLHVETIRATIMEPGYDLRAAWVEEKLDGTALHPQLFGSLDGGLLLRDPDRRLVLHVFDLKSGTHIVPTDAPQLRLYAFLLLIDPRTRHLLRHVWRVRLTVIQPFGYPMPSDGPVRTSQLNRRQILRTGWDFFETVRAATDPAADLPLFAGDHCQWCAAKPVCPEYARQQTEIRRERLEADFDVVDPADVEALFT